MAIRSCERIRSLNLIAPAGIRIKGYPIANVFIMTREQLTRALLSDETLISQELARMPSQEEVDQIVANTIASARLGWNPRFFNPRLRKWLHRVTAPTQLIWGVEDKITPPVYADEFQRLIPQSTVALLEKTGHLPFVEKLDEVVTPLSRFILEHR
jgi:pimeloyl-ACP methyl ester carboxylesterase